MDREKHLQRLLEQARSAGPEWRDSQAYVDWANEAFRHLEGYSSQRFESEVVTPNTDLVAPHIVRQVSNPSERQAAFMRRMQLACEIIQEAIDAID